VKPVAKTVGGIGMSAGEKVTQAQIPTPDMKKKWSPTRPWPTIEPR